MFITPRITVRVVVAAFAVGISLALLHVPFYIFHADLAQIIQEANIQLSGIDFAPEAWLVLLSLIFGTLIIVISIASQSTPKLIDYYIRDYKSLFYIWFITIGSFECIILQLVGVKGATVTDSFILLNLYIMLPVAIVMAIPYIFYILSYTKTSNVIDRIFMENLSAIRLATKSLKTSGQITEIQTLLFGTVNKLDDLFHYVQFKEPKGDIVKKLRLSLEFYLQQKANIQPGFFVLSQALKDDISFRTLPDKLPQIETEHTFYEHKVLRVLAGAYQKLIAEGHFDLASYCASELPLIGKAAHQSNEPQVVDLVLIEFNTFIRLGIKLGEGTKEIRNLYNCIFHYTQMVTYFITVKDKANIRLSCQFLTYYGKELYELSLVENSFIFIMDAFTDELRTVLIRLHENAFPLQFQEQILRMFMKTDPPFDDKDKNLDRIKNNGVRIIKIGLCLFYLDKDQPNFARIIVEDMFQDLEVLTTEEIRKVMDTDCHSLGEYGAKFWEDTDRGNRNIYYSPYKNQLDRFKKLVDTKLGALTANEV